MGRRARNAGPSSASSSSSPPPPPPAPPSSSRPPPHAPPPAPTSSPRPPPPPPVPPSSSRPPPHATPPAPPSSPRPPPPSSASPSSSRPPAPARPQLPNSSRRPPPSPPAAPSSSRPAPPARPQLPNSSRRPPPPPPAPPSSSRHAPPARPQLPNSLPRPPPPPPAPPYSSRPPPPAPHAAPNTDPSCSSSSSRPPPPAPPATNYASNRTDKEDRCYRFLNEYQERIGEPPYFVEAIHSMRNRSSYTINISYDQMSQFGDFELLISTCNERKHHENSWLLPAARRFLKDRALGDHEMIEKNTHLSYSGFPVSMQKLQDLKNDLVQKVILFRGSHFAIVPTSNGRLLLAALMVALLKNNKGASWNGAFTIADILIIDYGDDCKQVKILKEPVEHTERNCGAMVKDLKRVAEIIIPLYKVLYGDLPVYFSELQEELDGVTNQLVAQSWYRDYLCYHVALMSSTARWYLETMLYATCKNSELVYYHFLLEKPTLYLKGWKSELMEQLKKLGEHDIISEALLRVYSYNPHQVETDLYQDSVRGLMRYKRNFLEHGGEGQVGVCITELELCAAKVFCKFLPSLLRTLLEHGLTESAFGKAWKDFKARRCVVVTFRG